MSAPSSAPAPASASSLPTPAPKPIWRRPKRPTTVLRNSTQKLNVSLETSTVSRSTYKASVVKAKTKEPARRPLAPLPCAGAVNNRPKSNKRQQEDEPAEAAVASGRPAKVAKT